MRLDLGLTQSGGSSGQISVNGAEVTVLITGGRAYVRLNAAFLQRQHAPASVCRQVCGKYLRTSVQAAGMTAFTMSG